MKKLALMMAIGLTFLSFWPVFAELEWADPALCIDGQWLVVDSANDSAIEVTVARDARFGDQHAGGCSTPAPAPLLSLSRVKAKGNGNGVRVSVDGSQASPTVTVSYGAAAHTLQNHGGMMRFRFK